MLKRPVVVSGVRTATGKFGKSLASKEAPELGAIALKERFAALELSMAIIGLSPQEAANP